MKWLKAVGIATAALLLVQFVPYGRDHTNPPARQEPRWDLPETRELARRACFDCHSNETRWPWYSNVAPASWLIWRDVEEGRGMLNFSEWDRPQKEAKEAAKEVEEGEMPPQSYVTVHPEAKLDPAQREGLIRGLKATVGFEVADAATVGH